MSRRRDAGEDLRAALARVAEVARDGGDCPDGERLVASARGDLPRSDDEQVVLHLAECTACGAAWRVAREVTGATATADHVLPRQTRTAASWTRWTAAAAVLVAAIGGGILYRMPDRETVPVYREQGEDTLESLVDENTTLPRDDFLLRWTELPEGSIYDVVITDDRMRTLTRATGLIRAEFRAPRDAFEEVESGSRVFWQIYAYLPDGRTLESRTFIVRVQ